MKPPSCALAVDTIAVWATNSGLIYRHDALTGAGAVYDRDQQYRYLIWRVWRPTAYMLGFGMLNPSTAGHDSDDPTTTRCTKRAQRMAASDDIGGWIGWNLFGLRATDPEALRRCFNPVGTANSEAMLLAVRLSVKTIAAWGVHGTRIDRAGAVLRLLDSMAVPLHVLGLTKDGHPRHPLYVAANVELRRWEYGA